MKYASLDIETTGLDPLENNVLEVGVIIEDTNNKLPREECPTYHKYLNYPIYKGDPYALYLNAHIFKKILELRKSDPNNELIGHGDLYFSLNDFLKNHFGEGRILIAGKNVSGFDIPFIETLRLINPFPNPRIKFLHRTIDPAMLFTNFSLDTVPPDLATCKQRAEFQNTVVTHNALDDAWDVIELCRTKY